MRSHIDRLFSVSSAELCDICDRRIIQCPKRVLIKGLNTLLKAYFNAVGKEVVLAQKVLLLDFLVKFGIVFFAN